VTDSREEEYQARLFRTRKIKRESNLCSSTLGKSAWLFFRLGEESSGSA